MEETNDVPPANPAPPPAIPEYPKMIMDAIEALNESGGSNKTSIAQQIESTYAGVLPEAHPTLLAHHLDSMKSSGDLAFVKNNYLKPDPSAPPKRGRGRPPKAKAPPSDVTAATPSPSSRPRGRPPKKAKTTPPAADSPAGDGGHRRGRGRPPKVKPSEEASEPSSMTV